MVEDVLAMQAWISMALFCCWWMRLGPGLPCQAEEKSPDVDGKRYLDFFFRSSLKFLAELLVLEHDHDSTFENIKWINDQLVCLNGWSTDESSAKMSHSHGAFDMCAKMDRCEVHNYPSLLNQKNMLWLEDSVFFWSKVYSCPCVSKFVFPQFIGCLSMPIVHSKHFQGLIETP